MNGEAPSRERSHDDRSHITIHSSPTLVIQSDHPSNIEQLVQAALGRHHEELIDRVIREASRRERAEY